MIIKKYENINYVFAPPNDFCESEKYPLIIHFHGAGSRDDIKKLNEDDYVLLNYKREHKDYKFAVIMPHCEADTWFDIFEQVKRFVDYCTELPFVDTNRIYLSGISMGAYCAWQLLTSKNEVFAAALLCCGGGMYWNAARVKCPVWAFHGELDDVVYTNESRYYVDRINVYGGRAKLTVYPGVWHDCWEKAYRDPEIYEWLLSNDKKSNELYEKNKA